jgi:hypothetical protein
VGSREEQDDARDEGIAREQNKKIKEMDARFVDLLILLSLSLEVNNQGSTDA